MEGLGKGAKGYTGYAGAYGKVDRIPGIKSGNNHQKKQRGQGV